MQHVLCLQVFHQAVGDEFVVVGSTQPFGDGLECHQEAGEVGVLVKFSDFFERSLLAVALLQFEQRARLDRAFQMQMELGLG